MHKKSIAVVTAGLLLLTAGLVATGCPPPEQPIGPIGPGNVIFFHTDGYGLSHWCALRTYLVGPDGRLNWDRLPYMAPYTGHKKDALTGSSHGTGTTHAYGVRVLRDSFGLDGIQPITALSGKQASIMEEAIEAGFATALLQSACIAEAGTAVFIASVKDRGDKPLIAQQMIESGLDVILSGGERLLLPEGVQGRHGVGERKDGVNLIKRAKELGYTVVYTRDELMAAAANPAIRRVLGVFAHDGTYNAEPEEVLRAEGLPLYWPGAPTIYEMAEATLRILARNPRAQEKGIFIMAEDEATDDFGNNSNARGSFEAGRRSDKAMGLFLKFLANNPSTLLLNAADSSAGAKGLLGLHPGPMKRIREDKVTKGYHARWHNTGPGGERIFVPVDGIDGAGTEPFLAAPDRYGNRWSFVVQWLRDDVSGHTVARAKGLNAERVTELGIVDSTDIYRIMYYTLFDRWLER
jgi:alkaline phosphatase